MRGGLESKYKGKIRITRKQKSKQYYQPESYSMKLLQIKLIYNYL